MIDRTWKPGYSIQLAIGQGQVLVTPLQMARLYALIANGGKLVTPHIADDVELTGNDGKPARVLRRVRRAAAAADRRRPDRAPLRAAGARGGDALARSARRSACSATSRSTSPARRAAPRRTSRLPGLSAAAQPDAVVVVRVRAVRRADDRRLRGDRERRPRRHRRRAGRAEGVRAVLRQVRPTTTAPSRATDDRSKPSTREIARAARAPRVARPSGSAASLRRLDWLLLARARGGRRLRPLGDRRDHAPRPGRLGAVAAGALRLRRARCSSSPRSSSIPTATGVSGGRSTSGRSG